MLKVPQGSVVYAICRLGAICKDIEVLRGQGYLQNEEEKAPEPEAAPAVEAQVEQQEVAGESSYMDID